MDSTLLPLSLSDPQACLSAVSTAAGQDSGGSLLQPGVPSLPPESSSESLSIQPSPVHISAILVPGQLLPADDYNRRATKPDCYDSCRPAHTPFQDSDWDGVSGILNDPLFSHQLLEDQHPHPRSNRGPAQQAPRSRIGVSQAQGCMQSDWMGGQHTVSDACMLGHDLAGPTSHPGQQLLCTSTVYSGIPLDQSVPRYSPQNSDPGQHWQYASGTSAASRALADFPDMHGDFTGSASFGSAISPSDLGHVSSPSTSMHAGQGFTPESLPITSCRAPSASSMGPGRPGTKAESKPGNLFGNLASLAAAADQLQAEQTALLTSSSGFQCLCCP